MTIPTWIMLKASMLKTFRSKPEISLSILAGILIGTSYIPFPPWAILFCLVPLWLALLQVQTWKQAVFAGWLTQFVLNLIGFHWIAHTAAEFGHFPLWLAFLTLLAFAATAHLHFPISALLWFLLSRRLSLSQGQKIALIALCFAFIDSVMPMIFRWHFGYPWLWSGLPIAQTADLWGFQGLNVFTIFANAAVLYLWLHRRNRRVLISGTCLLAGVFVALNLLGVWRKNLWQNQPHQPLKVLVVQGNIGNLEKAAAEFGNRHYIARIIDTYLNLTRQGLSEHPDADVILWPETAYPDYLDGSYQYGPYARTLRDFLKNVDKPLWTGGYSIDQVQQEIYNAFYVVTPDEAVPIATYRKTHLLAFGEYLPGAQVFPKLKEWIPIVSNFGRGAGPQALQLDQLSLGPQICYEGLFPRFSGSLAQQDVDIFVNVTNDSWFGNSFEPRQHLIMTLARAIEFRRPLIRATNTGLTTGIQADGDRLTVGPQNTQWYGLFEMKVSPDAPQTVYSRWVGGWPWVLGLALLILTGWSYGRTRKSGLERDS